MKTRLIPFSVKKAKKGAKIVTREGRFPVRIVDYKIKDKYYPILALIEVDGREHPNTFTTNGKFSINKDEEDQFDLFIEVEAKEEEEVDNYNPYKETVKSISDMIERYPEEIDLQDFYDNVKVKCKEAVEYDKKWFKKQEEQKHSVNLKIMPDQWYVCTLGWESCGWDGDWKFLEGFSYPGSEILQCYPMDKNEIQNHFHPWTIQDAKDGDVLCYETKNELRIFIYNNGCYSNGCIHYHCHYYNEHLTTVDSFFVIQKHLLCYIHPATKEQYNLLFQKIKEEGYEWDKEKTELKKIEKKTRRMTNQELSDWLRKCPEECREFKYKEKPYWVYSLHDYLESEADEPVNKNKLIRRNHGDWEEPLVEI